MAEAGRFLRRVRRDFANRDAIDRGELDPELECACNLCWAENFASIRALAAWEWMHTEGPWAWKRREEVG